MNKIKILLALSVAIISYFMASTAIADNQFKGKLGTDISDRISQFIVEENTYTFYGLASYYNTIHYFLIKSNSIKRIVAGDNVVLADEEWLTVVSRLNVLVLKAEGLEASLRDGTLSIDNEKLSTKITIQNINKSELFKLSPELNQIRYNHLWKPLAFLAKGVEYILVSIQENIIGSWGWTVIIFACLLKILFLPVGIITVNLQRKVSQIRAKLAPQLSEIKATCDGEEAHNRIMAAHKELGVSPFYALKPLLGSFIQVPILIAVFNALGEMPQFNQQPFLWIESLAHPDVGGQPSITLLLFGNTISILPFIMTAITFYSTVIFKNPHAPKAEVKRQKRNLYLMAATFFILFYPFPAVMVLYWALANVLQTIQQQQIKV